jgi:hypothetical protein
METASRSAALTVPKRWWAATRKVAGDFRCLHSRQGAPRPMVRPTTTIHYPDYGFARPQGLWHGGSMWLPCASSAHVQSIAAVFAPVAEVHGMTVQVTQVLITSRDNPCHQVAAPASRAQHRLSQAGSASGSRVIICVGRLWSGDWFRLLAVLLPSRSGLIAQSQIGKTLLARVVVIPDNLFSEISQLESAAPMGFLIELAGATPRPGLVWHR